VYPEGITRRMFQQTGMEEPTLDSMAARFSARFLDFSTLSGRCDLIERQTLNELVSMTLVHTDFWWLRITVMEAESALVRLVECLQRQPSYKLAVTRQSLVSSVVLRPDQHFACAEGELVSRSPEMYRTLASHFEKLWSAADTVSDREAVIALLHGRIEAMHRRVIL
jgi:hypothetical protein